jgi:hypothetical protein
MLSLASDIQVWEGFLIPVEERGALRQVENSTGMIESIARIALAWKL